jgi:hypothetical protein
VRNTLADAIGNYEGARDTVVADNTVRNAGDDMISVVTYVGLPQARNILIQDNDVADQTSGRAISVVGGSDVTIQGNHISNTANGGVYLASETADPTTGDSNILVERNVLTDVSRPGSGYAGIELDAFDPGYPIDGVVVEKNVVARSGTNGVMITGNVRNVAVVDTRILDPARAAMALAGRDIYCSGNTWNGTAADPASCSKRRTFWAKGASIKYVDCRMSFAGGFPHER